MNRGAILEVLAISFDGIDVKLYSFKPGVGHDGNILSLFNVCFVDFDSVPEVAQSLSLLLRKATIRHVEGACSDFSFLYTALHIFHLSL